MCACMCVYTYTCVHVFLCLGARTCVARELTGVVKDMLVEASWVLLSVWSDAPVQKQVRQRLT